MKRTLQIALALAAVLMFSAQALAVSIDDYWYTDWLGNEAFDQAGYDLAVAEEKVSAAGIDLDASQFLSTDADGLEQFDNAAFTAAYDAVLDEKDKPQTKPDESAGTKNEQSTLLDDNNSGNDNYPIGSYVDEAGNVFSPEGELLSPGTTPAGEPVGGPALPGDVLDTQSPFEASPVEIEPPVYLVSDMRSALDSAGSSPVGLKALVVSIFGEYTPVMTTAVVTETVGNETTTTLIDAVADGAAGVDYEWCAGVLLFGILLFCLMKLLGGVLK